MKYKKKKKLGSFPIVSVVFSITLALFVIGLFGLLILHSNKLKDVIRENITIQVYLDKFVTENDKIRINKILTQKKYVAKEGDKYLVEYVSKEDAAKLFIESTGEDFIEFFGTMNYGSPEYREANGINEPYTEYIDRYTDTTIYWLTWGNDFGSRIDTLSYNGISFQDTIDYYTEITHYEQNNFFDYFTRNLIEWQNPEWIQNETWFWGGQG